jgi:hypothetical protein
MSACRLGYLFQSALTASEAQPNFFEPPWNLFLLLALSFRIGEIKMRNHSFIAAGLGLAVTMAVLAVGLKISATPTWSATDPAQQSINRSLKGDRSPLLPARTTNQTATSFPGDTIVVPELLDGCEPVISSIGESLLARVAGSCQS